MISRDPILHSFISFFPVFLVSYVLGAGTLGSFGVGLQLSALVWTIQSLRLRGKIWSASILPWIIFIIFMYHGFSFFIADYGPIGWFLSDSHEFRLKALLFSGIATWSLVLGFETAKNFLLTEPKVRANYSPLLLRDTQFLLMLSFLAIIILVYFLASQNAFFSRFSQIRQTSYLSTSIGQLIWTLGAASLYFGILLMTLKRNAQKIPIFGFIVVASILLILGLSGSRLNMLTLMLSGVIMYSRISNKEIKKSVYLFLGIVVVLWILWVAFARAGVYQVGNSTNALNSFFETAEGTSYSQQFFGGALNRLPGFIYRINAVDMQAVVAESISEKGTLKGEATKREIGLLVPAFLWPDKKNNTSNAEARILEWSNARTPDSLMTIVTQAFADWGYLLGAVAMFVVGLVLGLWQSWLSRGALIWKELLFASSLPTMLHIEGSIIGSIGGGMRAALLVTAILMATLTIIHVINDSARRNRRKTQRRLTSR